MRKASLLLVFLVVAAFSLAAWVQPRLIRNANGREADNVFKVLLGEGRRMFANEFAVKADVYMHSGLYPSIFDQAGAMKEYGDEEGKGGGYAEEADAEHDHDHEAKGPDSHTANFLGQPKDWIEAMGRHFMVTRHTHLEGGREREILPWLKLSAELDPQRIETYAVTAYWLADRLNKPKEAEDFLRQGLRANPQSYEILFDLGRIYEHHFKQPDRARGVWLLALRRWDEVERVKEKPDKNGRDAILVHLAQLELGQGNPLEAVRYLEEAKKYSPDPGALDERIREIRPKLAPPPPGTTPATH